MLDSFYHHRTRQNLSLLKSTLISRPIKIFDPNSIFPSSDSPFEDYHSHPNPIPSYPKPKYINAFFKETSTYKQPPSSSPMVKDINNPIKGMECSSIKRATQMQNKMVENGFVSATTQISGNGECSSLLEASQMHSREKHHKIGEIRYQSGGQHQENYSNDRKSSIHKLHRMPPLPLFRAPTSQTEIYNSNGKIPVTVTKSPATQTKRLTELVYKQNIKPHLTKEKSLPENNGKNVSSIRLNNENMNSRVFSSSCINNVSGEKKFEKPVKTPKIKAKSWVIFEENTEKMLFSLKPRKSREIASLTKIMTCYLACYFIEKFEMNPSNHFVKVPKAAVKLGGTSAELERGDSVSVKDLLYGMMLPSGNDAAYCLANFFGKLAYILYQEEKIRPFGRKKQKFSDIYREKWHGEFPYKDFVKFFVCEMNKTARNNGLLNTIFNNPHGLPDSINKSAAEDIGKLSILSLKSKLFKEIVNTKEYYCTIKGRDQEIREMCWRNFNELLNKGFNGIKTGNTPTAGPCFAGSFQKNDNNLIIVVLKTRSEDARFADTFKLLKWFLKSQNMNWNVLK